MSKSVDELMRIFDYHPVGPYRAEPYDAVRGITWTIVDGNDRHIATVFEKESAMLIAHRLNQ